MPNVVEVHDLYKKYGDIQAVNGIDFYVEEGTLFAFLGPNGAGKSTTINILSTILTYDNGKIEINGHVLGHEDSSIRSSIGIVFQDHVLDDFLTIRENLETRGSFYNLEKEDLKTRIIDALKVTGIENIADRRYGTLSGGQKRRADIARALINSPKLLFLDEPTTGLDPQTRKTMWETISNLQKETKMTVFLTTHYLEEADKADYVVIIDNGIIAAKGTPAYLRNTYSSHKLLIVPTDKSKMVDYLNKNKIDYKIKNDVVQIKIETSLDSIEIINQVKDLVKSFQVLDGTLDEAFIEVTGKEIRE